MPSASIKGAQDASLVGTAKKQRRINSGLIIKKLIPEWHGNIWVHEFAVSATQMSNFHDETVNSPRPKV